MKIINIPNIITGLNLMSGSIAILMFLEGKYLLGFYLIIAALIFDFFDGFAARLLKISSPVGKELDSLADMVSFGLFPGIIIYVLLESAFPADSLIKYTAFIYTVFSAFRLAKFNLDTRQEEDFIGLATPSGTLFLLGLFFSCETNFLGLDASNWILTMIISVVLSLLLISEIPFFSLKIKGAKWKGNEEKTILVLFSICMLILFKFNSMMLIIGAYILYNTTKYFLVKK